MLAAGLARSRLNKVAALLAIVVPTSVVALAGLDRVGLVEDVGDISGGLPTPFLPSLSDLSPDVVTGALSVAVVVLVQGAGVSQSLASSEGKRVSISRDFAAQGAAGVVRGLPVGGSFKGTALSASAGAERRWAAIFSGLWMLLFVVAFSGLVSIVAMPALGVS